MILSKEQLKEATRLKKNLKEQPVELYEDPEDFILNCYNGRTPQSYGLVIENRIIQKNSMKKVSKMEQRGDIIEEGVYKEIKCSISDHGYFNVVQIRPRHDIHSYLLFFFEIDENNNVINHFFEIPKDDIIKIPGLTAAHGLNNSNNSMIEYRVSFDKSKEKEGSSLGQAWKFIQGYKIHRNF